MATAFLTLSDDAKRVIDAVTTAIKKSPTGVSFVSIKGYVNSNNEMSNNLINVGASYEKAKKADVETLQNLDLTTIKTATDLITLEKARTELINGLIAPDKARSEGQIDAYFNICKGVKAHRETGELYIYGYREKKEVIVKGEYPTVNSRPLTIAKNELRKLLKTGKFTQYKVSNIDNMKLNGETLEF